MTSPLDTCKFCSNPPMGKYFEHNFPDICYTCWKALTAVQDTNPAVLEKIIRHTHLERFVAHKK